MQSSKLKFKVQSFPTAVVLAVLIFLFSGRISSVYGQVNTAKDKPKFVPNEVIVRYKPGQSPQDLEQTVLIRKERQKTITGRFQNWTENVTLQVAGQELPETKLEQVQKVQTQTGVVKEKKLFTSPVLGEVKAETPPKQLQNFVVYKTDGRESVEEMVKRFKSLPEAAGAMPNFILTPYIVPNDTYYSQMWSLRKIQIEQAWDISRGSNSVIAAVVDSGLNYDHEDFNGRQIIKWDVNGNDDDTRGDDPHGTHVAGTIGAVTNNSKGIAGINWQVTLMGVKIASDSGTMSADDMFEGITFAADHGAKVINMSFGVTGSKCSDYQEVQDIIDYAYNKGAVSVVSAGNDNEDIDVHGSLPADCRHVISVAATGPNDERAAYSSYGASVDIAAPGGSSFTYPCTVPDFRDCHVAETDANMIHSTTRSPNVYELYQGTSMAAPHVAGVVALMLSVNSSLTPDQVENILKSPSNTDPVTTEAGKPIGRRLNAYKAVLAAGGGTNSPTPTRTPTATRTPTPGVGATSTPTRTLTPTRTVTPILTATRTPSPTKTPMPSATPTPGCTAGSFAGYKVILKISQQSNPNVCLFKEYHVNTERIRRTGGNAGFCPITLPVASCN